MGKRRAERKRGGPAGHGARGTGCGVRGVGQGTRGTGRRARRAPVEGRGQDVAPACGLRPEPRTWGRCPRGGRRVLRSHAGRWGPRWRPWFCPRPEGPRSRPVGSGTRRAAGRARTLPLRSAGTVRREPRAGGRGTCARAGFVRELTAPCMLLGPPAPGVRVPALGSGLRGRGASGCVCECRGAAQGPRARGLGTAALTRSSRGPRGARTGRTSEGQLGLGAEPLIIALLCSLVFIYFSVTVDIQCYSVSGVQHRARRRYD